MDAEKILLAIDEKKKWEERTAALEKELEALRRQRLELQAELKGIEERLKFYSAMADAQRQVEIAMASGMPFETGKLKRK